MTASTTTFSQMSRGGVTMTEESAYPQQAEFQAQMEEQKAGDRAAFKKQ